MNKPQRPLCKVCNQRPAAINYIKNEITYYRSRCDSCLYQPKRKKIYHPKWMKDGYKKKNVCDICKFKARWMDQIIVYYKDGNMNNTKLSNLRSICLNCSVSIEKGTLPWKKDITPDR